MDCMIVNLIQYQEKYDSMSMVNYNTCNYIKDLNDKKSITWYCVLLYREVIIKYSKL